MPIWKSTVSLGHDCCRVKLAEKVCLASLLESIVSVRVDCSPVKYKVGLLERVYLQDGHWWTLRATGFCSD